MAIDGKESVRSRKVKALLWERQKDGKNEESRAGREEEG
jgi:hypothetical protein